MEKILEESIEKGRHIRGKMGNPCRETDIRFEPKGRGFKQGQSRPMTTSPMEPELQFPLFLLDVIVETSQIEP